MDPELPQASWWQPWVEWLTAQRGYEDFSRRDKLIYQTLLAGITLGFLHAILWHPSYVGSFGDIRYFHYIWEVSRRSILEYGQFPWWSPWHCGGTAHAGNAQSMFLSPFLPFSLAFGAGVGIRLFLVAHFFVALYGGIALSRELGVRGPGTWLAGFAFAFNGFFAERATGHVAFSTLTYLPWLIWAYLRARGGAGLVGSDKTRLPDLRYALLLGLLVVLATWQGGVYPTPLLILTLIVYAGVDVGAAVLSRLRGKSDPSLPAWYVPLLVGLVGAAVYFTVGAIKWWPVLDFLVDYPRLEPMKDALSPLQMGAVFLRRVLERHNPDYVYVFGEYRNYLGPVVVGLALASLRWIKSWYRLWLVCAVFLAFMAGNHGILAPYALFNKIPPFGSLRVPARYAIIVDIHLAVMAGWVVTRIIRWGRSHWHAWLGRVALVGALILILVGAIDLLEVNNNMFPGLFNTPPPRPRAGRFRQTAGHGGEMFRSVVVNRGVARCYEPNHVPTSSALRFDLPDEAYLGSADAGTVSTAAWSPNRVTLRYALLAPATVILNQNHHRHWHARLLGTQGQVLRELDISSHGGLVATALPPGRGELEFYYRPWFAGLAQLLSLLGLLACVAAFFLLAPPHSLHQPPLG